MRIPRFYINQPLKVGLKLDLPTVVHRHAIQVLRLKTNERLILFNGKGGEYLAILCFVDKHHSRVSILSFNNISRESPLNITLALAMIKQDKMDFAIQKAVEMGVQQIQPLDTQRSVIKLKNKRLEKKLAHWQRIIRSACEQSGRTLIPKILPATALELWLQRPRRRLSLAMLPGKYPSIASLSPLKEQKITLIIGPEGGFTKQEVNLFINAQVKAIQLGSRILRAETAVIAGLALCQQQWGDLSHK